MADGSFKNIEDIIIGDILKSVVIPTYPNGEDFSNWYPASVWNINSIDQVSYENTTVTAIKSIVTSGYYNINNKYKVTGEHFIFAESDALWQFIRARDLTTGNSLLVNGNAEIIESIEYMPDVVRVMDIDVEPNDLFIADGVVNHNIKML